MTSKQTTFYWRLWAAVKKALVARGMTTKEADAERHALHVKALGFERSSKSLTNAQFDKVIGVFRAEIDGGDMDAQMRQDRMAQTRLIFAVEVLLTVLEKERDYAQRIVAQMNREHALGPDELQLEELSEDLINDKLIPALKKHCRRNWPTKEDLIRGIQIWCAETMFDPEEAESIVCKALHTPRPLNLDTLVYENLLTAWALLRRSLTGLPHGQSAEASPDQEPTILPF